jgi:hypothetical protein
MFRFTIRDVLLLTVIVALAVAWWAEHARASKLANRERYLLQAIDRSGYMASGDNAGPILFPKDLFDAPANHGQKSN